MYRFNDYLEFYAFLQDHPFLVTGGSVSVFHEAVRNISEGCNCSRTKRIRFAQEKYLGLGDGVDDAFKENLKILLEAQKILFYHEDHLFLEIV